MQNTDMAQFGTMLDAVCSLLSRGAYQPSPTNTALFFRSLGRYSLAEVRAAFDAHVADPQRGRFVPVPADILAQLEGIATQDGRPGVEEAWALAMRSTDEGDTVVWTSEVAEAMGVCQPILNAGDEVGARMAFKESYARIIDAARRARIAPQWTPSIGHDPERRSSAIAAAVAAGHLQENQFAALPSPRAHVALLAAPDHGVPAEALAGLKALRAWLTEPRDEISEDAAAKADTMMAKHDAQVKVDRYTVPVPKTPPTRHWSEMDDSGPRQ
jgi:hypothetical protein